ncbi:hypothetical protein, partial [Pseudomonas aeruginosa]|uniref:hypothetical protein n=2 Tax=Pseudomonas aeruginosa TaxID=287 RepID=UPI001ABCB2F8
DPGSGHHRVSWRSADFCAPSRFSSGPQSRGSQRVDVAFFPSSALEAFHSSTAPYRVRPGWRAGVFVQLEVVVFGSLIFCRYLLLLLFNFLSEYIQFTGGIILFSPAIIDRRYFLAAVLC